MKRTIQSRVMALLLLVLCCAWTGSARAGNEPSDVHIGTSVGASGHFAAVSPPDTTQTARVKADYGRLPLLFEKNQGQFTPEVRFVSRGSNFSLALKEDEARLELRAPQVLVGPPQKPDVLQMKLVGANARAQVSALQPRLTKVNYFIGRDSSKWHSNVSTSGQVLYGGVYPGIDLIYYGNQQQLEYDFRLAPHANPAAIRMRWSGARHITINAHGELVLGVGSEKVVQRAPIVYQQSGGKRLKVAGRYIIRSARRREVGFEVGHYDHSKPLVIDPVLSYSTFLGDGVDSIAVDSAGNAYVTGSSESGAVAGVVGTHLSTARYATAFVAKLNAKGDALLYVTFFGGSSSTRSVGIAVDDAGQAYVTGSTIAPDFPTQNAFQPKLATNGTYPDPNPPGYELINEDAFLLKLNAEGSALLYSTYFGGGIDNSRDSANPSSGRNKGNEDAYGIAVDNAGRAYISGSTNSVDLPVRNAVQNTLSASTLGQTSYASGDEDAFVAAFDTTDGGDASLLYSTYLGSAELSQAGQPVTNSGSNDRGYAIAVAGEQKVVVTGVASPFTAPGFPIKNALQSTSGGTYNAFVSEIDISKGGQDSLVFSTYLGGAGGDVGRGITVDKAGNIYVTGVTSSPTLAGKTPVLLGPGGGNDAFVANLSPLGESLVYLTRFGGSDSDLARNIAVDDGGNAYVSGATSSKDFPLRDPLPDSPVVTGSDNYVVELNSIGSAFQYSTRLGIRAAQGDATFYSPAIAVSSTGDLYVGGDTSSTDFPLKNPIQSTKSSYSVGFVSKLNAASRGLVVNSTGDLSDSDTSDGACGTGKALPDGNPECTLRAAIEEANVQVNATSGPDTITFDIPGSPIPAIQITSALPTITEAVTIDGTTQPGGKMVELSGGGTVANGLTITAGNSKLRGLVVNSFKNDGILLMGKGGNTVKGCFIGTDATGTLARGNGQSGIHALNSPNNLFGGATDAARNIISGNRVPSTSTTPDGDSEVGDRGCGIWIDGSTNNKVQGCFVGTDKSGTKGVPNGIGVLVGKATVPGTTTSLPKLSAVIGGATASPGSAPGNLIAVNTNVGVYVGAASGNSIVGNLIGIARDGKTSLANARYGVAIFRAPGNTVGATSAGGRNVIGGGEVAVGIIGNQASKNSVVGNFIGTDIHGTGGNGPKGLGGKVGIFVSAASGNTIGGTTEGARNVICNNDGGIVLAADARYRGPGNLNGSADKNRVSGNYIGVDVSGRKVFSNASEGLALFYEATGNIVENNVVAGSKIGVDLSSDNGRVKGNFVRSNLIGTDASGTLPLPNEFGLVVSGTQENTIKANVLAGNSVVGLTLYKGADENSVVGNSIGTDRSGTRAIGNGQYGVLILDSSRNTLQGNVVSGNGHAGVVVAAQLPPSYALADLPPVTDQALEAAGNKLELNFIGTTLSGHGPLANGSRAAPGTGGGVLLLSGAMGNSIGGERLGNTISGNAGSGVLLLSEANLAAVSGNVLAANNIGVAVDGASPLPNSGSGVRFVGANNNGIGSAPKQKNIIAFNQGDGVTVVSGKGNAILANSIHENRRLGINLVGGTQDSFGVTANDELDADQGANGLQNYPELTQVARVGNNTSIEATLNSTPNKKFIIEFFSNDKRDPSGFGQGRRSLGVLPVTTDAAGVAAIGTLVPGVLSADQSVSMTATGDGGTSEFSGLGYSITGQVYRFVPDPANPQGTIGQGIEGAIVERLEGQGKDARIAATTLSNAQGFYVFGAAPAGTYAIIVKKDAPNFSYDFDPGGRIVTLPAPRSRSDAPNLKGVDFVTYNISGQVADSGGKPLAGVPIGLAGISGNSKESAHDVKRTVVSDKQGHYVFDGLGLGAYAVVAGYSSSPIVSPTLVLPAFGNVKGSVPGTPGIAPNRVFNFTLKAPEKSPTGSGGHS